MAVDVETVLERDLVDLQAGVPVIQAWVNPGHYLILAKLDLWASLGDKELGNVELTLRTSISGQVIDMTHAIVTGNSAVPHPGTGIVEYVPGINVVAATLTGRCEISQREEINLEWYCAALPGGSVIRASYRRVEIVRLDAPAIPDKKKGK